MSGRNSIVSKIAQIFVNREMQKKVTYSFKNAANN